jgi:peroxiredoxin
MSSSETPSAPTEASPRRGPSLRALLTIGMIALMLIVGGLLLYPSSSSNSSSGGAATIGGHVPHFSLQALDDSGAVSVPADGGGHGQAAVLVFFAAWCTECQAEMPALSAAITAGKAGGATVIGIDALDERTVAVDFVAAQRISFPVGYDAIGAVTNGIFGFPALPEVVFVNARGIITEIQWRHHAGRSRAGRQEPPLSRRALSRPRSGRWPLPPAA